MDDLIKSRRSLPAAIAAVCQSWASSRSKDPSTKVGAAVFDSRTGSLHLGYNGFPAGIPDSQHLWNQRDPNQIGLCKYDLVVHAEVNAVRKALQSGGNPADWILVCTHMPCAKCWKDVIASVGIKQVYYINGTYPSQTKTDIMVGNYFIATLNISIRKVGRNK